MNELARIRQAKQNSGLSPEAWVPLQPDSKEPQRFRVLNRARESFLSFEVIAVETATEPMKKLIEELALNADSGLWLKPYRGIPGIPGSHPPFDLLYLDENHRVLQEVESWPNPNVEPLTVQPASAVALPAHTVFASHVRAGDQLEFQDATQPGEVEHGFKVLSRPPVTVPAGDSEPAIMPRKDASAASPPEQFHQVQIAIKRLDQPQGAESEAAPKGSWLARIRRWLVPGPSDRRVTGRHPLPSLVAYHWTGGTPQAYHLGDISDTGLYLLTQERPFPGTIILMTLQRTDTSGDSPLDSVAVQTKVVRWGPDGVGLELMPSKSLDRGGSGPENGADTKALAEFLKRLHMVIKD